MKLIKLINLLLARLPFVDYHNKTQVSYIPPTLSELQRMSENDRSREFLAFLKSRPKNEPYEYNDSTDCALARFGKTIAPHAEGGSSSFTYYTFYRNAPILSSLEFVKVIPDNSCIVESRTMGQAAKKLARQLARN